MSVNYLLIDDDTKGDLPVEGYAEQLIALSQGSLKVETYRPTSIQEVLKFIAEKKPDGILMDVAFTNAPTEDRAPLPYDGIALAQQIRTLQTRGMTYGEASLPEFPIVRFSKADVIREYVGGDTTSEDLFEERVYKETIIDYGETVARQLVSLAIDYPVINEYAAKNEKSDEALARLLGCEEEFLSRIDARALLGLRRSDAPTHVLSRFLTGPIFSRPGPMIDEELLAIRLGIDQDKSSDWSSLLETLNSTKYKGVFAQGYGRWWMALVLEWWNEQVDSERPLIRLSAYDRVDTIKEQMGMSELVPIAEDHDSPGTKFWHRCVKSTRPVDPTFGFPLMSEWGQETWHDVDYLCLEEAKRDPRNPRFPPAERKRIAKLLRDGTSV
jgi:CheY-like chemotaxis protein